MPTAPAQSARSRLVTLCEKALFRTNAHHLCRLLNGNGGTTILIYHSVPGPELAPWIDPSNATPPELFAWQMRFLAAHRRVVPLAELAEAVERGKSLEPGSVVITLDDGYLDNHQVAAPILAELGLPATFFLATGYVDRESPQWIDQIWSLYRARTAQTLHVAPVSARYFDLTDQRDVDQSYSLLAHALLEGDIEERDRLFEQVTAQLRPSAAPPRLTMRWQEVRDLCAMHAGFQVGVHTRDHLSLPTRSVDRMVTELTRCLADVRGNLGVDARWFSFPYGRTCARAKLLVAARFRAAVITDPPALVHERTDPLALPRLAPPADPALFQLYTSGVQPNMVRRLLRRA